MKRQLIKPYRLQLFFNGAFYFEELFKFPYDNYELINTVVISEYVYGKSSNFYLLPEIIEGIKFQLGFLGLPEPDCFSLKKVQKAMDLLVSKNKAFLLNRTQILLLGFKDLQGKLRTDCLIKIEKEPDLFFSVERKGLRIDLMKGFFRTTNKLSFIKSYEKELKIIGHSYCVENELDDLIVANDKRFVSGTLCGNIIFFVKNNAYSVPDVESPFYSVYKNKALELLKELGYNILSEHSIAPDILNNCEEILLINEDGKVMWVLAMRERRFTNKSFKLLCSSFSKDFDKL